MKIAIMQPYLFPYIGYFQLINSVDKFVVYDDVQYISRGWINRNNILVNNQKYLFTLSVKKSPQKDNINQKLLSDNNKSLKDNFLKTIDFAYHKAPYYKQVKNLISQCLEYGEQNISLFITNSLNLICNYLKINTSIILSSTINDGKNLKKQARIINITKILKGDHYINSNGGKDLYSKEEFIKHGIKLNFIQSYTTPYKQFKNEFIPYLSIIDIMMFNNIDEINKLLNNYILV